MLKIVVPQARVVFKDLTKAVLVGSAPGVIYVNAQHHENRLVFPDK